MAAASEPSVDKTTPSLRKVEFHLARKPQSFSPNVNPNFKLETLNPNSYIKSTLVPCSQQPSSSSSFNSRLVDTTDFFEDAVLAFRMPLRRIGAGLENLGNTCFLNAVIQCLTYTEPLVGYLQNGKHENTCRVAGFCALCAIQKHISRALQASGRSLAPKDLVSHLRSISRNFRNARQEDAHEFMIHLLESMHKCCLPSGVQAESPGAYEKSLVHRIFGGRLRSQVKCLQCSHCSNTFDPFLDLSLEIVKADSLHKALKNFTAPEQLDGGERQYKCEKCKHKVKALKQLTVSRAPYVLTIHLKRFRSHFSGQKIDKKVQFGPTLDLKPFVTGEYEGDLTYTLYGVLVHAGYSTHSGHYYCFVRTSNGLWYSLDDNRVIQVSERMVMEQKAYMLFYVRDRKKFVSKKAMAMVQKENLLQTMRNVSSAVPSINHGAAEKNTKEAIQSGLFVKQVENSKSSEIVAQPKLSSSLKQELSNNLGKISSEPSVLENDNNSPIPKPNLAETTQSTRCAENNRAQTTVVTTVLGGGSDSNNEPMGDSSFLEEKTASRDCSSNAANGLGALASDMAKDDKPAAVVLPDSITQETITQETIASKAFKNEKVRKVRLKEKRVDKLLSGGDLLRRGPVKKISKSRAVGMHLSTKMLYFAAVSLRKRKKSKKMKQQSKLNLPEKLLNEEGLPANTTSVVALASSGVEISYSLSGSTDSGMAVNGSCSREGQKDASKEFQKNSSCNSSVGKLDEVLNSRIKSNQAVLASVKLSKETISMETQCNDGDVSFAEKQNLPPQNGVLVETTGWGGIEFPSKNAEDNVPEVVTIGHVPDEWDEEYDRGKRKKVRGLRNDFSGPNVFQEIASKKAKLKAKTGQRISSINEPFRI
ncbi:uncharacterized protein LOC141602722 [Silene latifolia]|uniref:uncharacterized protein LOC141602722 n=1 Tax=Silene latifolia TaxID=37657 RepID=UPI003D77CAD5